MARLKELKERISMDIKPLTGEEKEEYDTLVNFCKKLDLALADEEKAAKDYNDLTAFSEEEKATAEIFHIYTDEKEHAKILTKIKERLCE